MNRSEYLVWCKARALAYVDAGDLSNAWASLAADLGQHPETAGHPTIKIGMMLVMGGGLKTAAEMRRFIEGFN